MPQLPAPAQPKAGGGGVVGELQPREVQGACQDALSGEQEEEMLNRAAREDDDLSAPGVDQHLGTELVVRQRSKEERLTEKSTRRVEAGA